VGRDAVPRGANIVFSGDFTEILGAKNSPHTGAYLNETKTIALPEILAAPDPAFQLETRGRLGQ